MKRSHGYYSKHSRNLKRKKRGITKQLAEFKVGSTVKINVDAGTKGKIPLRFNGRMAKIIAKRGKGYVIQFKDLNAVKQISISTAHLE